MAESFLEEKIKSSKLHVFLYLALSGLWVGLYIKKHVTHFEKTGFAEYLKYNKEIHNVIPVVNSQYMFNTTN